MAAISWELFDYTVAISGLFFLGLSYAFIHVLAKTQFPAVRGLHLSLVSLFAALLLKFAVFQAVSVIRLSAYFNTSLFVALVSLISGAECTILAAFLALTVQAAVGFADSRRWGGRCALAAPWLYGGVCALCTGVFEISTVRANLSNDYLAIAMFLVKYLIISGLLVTVGYVGCSALRKAISSSVDKSVLWFACTIGLCHCVAHLTLDFFPQSMMGVESIMLFEATFTLFLAMYLQPIRDGFSNLLSTKVVNNGDGMGIMGLKNVKFPIQISVMDAEKQKNWMAV